jgi:hypothetical protein
MERAEAVKTITEKLGEVEREPLNTLKAIVKILGPEQALAFCERAPAGGARRRDADPRRQPPTHPGRRVLFPRAPQV